MDDILENGDIISESCQVISKKIEDIFRELATSEIYALIYQFVFIQTNLIIDQIIAARISKSVRLAAANLPWRTDCIIQAMAAQHLLKRHEIKSSGFVGINRSNDNLATAHMWLKTGDIFITGQTSKKFKSVISLTDTKVAL